MVQSDALAQLSNQQIRLMYHGIKNEHLVVDQLDKEQFNIEEKFQQLLKQFPKEYFWLYIFIPFQGKLTLENARRVNQWLRQDFGNSQGFL